jgi:hypothetical protein
MLGKSKSRRQTADGFRFSLNLQLVNKYKYRKYYFEENVSKMPVYVETSRENAPLHCWRLSHQLLMGIGDLSG